MSCRCGNPQVVQLHSPAMAEPSVRDPSAPPLRARHPVAPDPVRPRATRRPERATVDPSGPRSTEREPARTGRPARGDTLPSDRRRLAAAIASSLLPGFGQALNGRLRAALLFGIPTLSILAGAWLIAQSDRPAMLIARAIAPAVLTALLVLNVVILAWRAIAVVQAFMDRRYPLRPGRLGTVGLAVLLVATTVPNLLAWSYGT